ncbi:MAG: excinuclease ABC subunit C [Dinghuibacter sp.]|nr:excinuclease ABC subunit C [Dinghuibacter sp.]
MTPEEFQQINRGLPDQPGIYKYFNNEGELIYVGKAKHLRKRISSYFTKTFTSYKTVQLVKSITRIEFVVTNTEQDAFFLENTLIKQFQPRYNINLKDDKTYPWIVIKKEPFPRVFLTRKKIADGSEYLGPFTSVARVRDLLAFIRQVVPLRTCKLNLAPAVIAKGKYKVCLEYHLGNCKGPCAGIQQEEAYRESLQQVKNLLRGNLGPVIQSLKKEMETHAASLQFERAAQLKKKIEFLRNYSARSVVVDGKSGTVDVFALQKKDDTVYICYLMVEHGSIIQTHHTSFQSHFEETTPEILSYVIPEIRNLFNSTAREILVAETVNLFTPDITVAVPKTGHRKQLLDLAFKNIEYYIRDLENKKRLNTNRQEDTTAILESLMDDLQLQQLPVHIECFDNSNFQGAYPVSAMVCFRNGLPAKNEYRKYNIKTVTGINDFASMKEVVYRRYKRLTEEQQPLPQLVIIDGGKGQLNAALESIHELNLEGSITLIGLAKNIEEVFFAGDKDPLKLAYTSSSLKLLRQIRDEVHRTGVGFHRDKRSKGTFKTGLSEIKGIGPATVNLLLKTYKSIKNIMKAEQSELEQLIGKAKAAILRAYLEEMDRAEKK